MKIDILLIIAIMSGNLVAAAAEQANKSHPEHQTAQRTNAAAADQNPITENSAVSESGATWGRHDPLKNCVSCHSGMSKGNLPDKNNLAAPVPASCYLCHKQYDKQGGWVHGPVATGECLLCHTAHKSDNESLLNKPIPELCYGCHESETLELIANHSDESYAHCNVCHAGHVSGSRMLLKTCFLNADEGLIYISKDPSAVSRPEFVDHRNSLVGLQGVKVVPVVDGAELLKRYGVAEKSVRAEVERLLRQNGIKVLDPAEQPTKQPSLQVHLRLMEVPFGRPERINALSGSFNIFLRQTVELLQTPDDVKKRYCEATTWDTGAIFIWGTSQIEEGLKEAVDVLVGRFSNDYLAANPKAGISVSADGGEKPL